MNHETGKDHRTDGVQPERERRDDAEVAAAPAQRPEQIRVLVGAGDENVAVGGHHLRLDEVVAGQTVLPGQPAEPAAKRQPGDTGVGVRTTGRRQTVLLRRCVELRPPHPRLDAGGTVRRINLDALHQRQVDHHAARTHGVACGAVITAANRHDHTRSPHHPKRRNHVGDIEASRDDRRPTVDHAVPDRAYVVEAGVGCLQHRTAQRATQIGNIAARQPTRPR
jgi:hypothetical protein